MSSRKRNGSQSVSLVPEQVPEDRLRVEEQRAQREREVEADREARRGRSTTSDGDADRAARERLQRAAPEQVRARRRGCPRLRDGRRLRTIGSIVTGRHPRLRESDLALDGGPVDADHDARQRARVPRPGDLAAAERDARAGASGAGTKTCTSLRLAAQGERRAVRREEAGAARVGLLVDAPPRARLVRRLNGITAPCADVERELGQRRRARERPAARSRVVPV